jgi:hypothetical protein
MLEEFQRRKEKVTDDSETEQNYADSDLVSKNVNNFIIYSCAEGLIILFCKHFKLKINFHISNLIQVSNLI